MDISFTLRFYTIASCFYVKETVFFFSCNKFELTPHPGQVAVITGGHRGIGAVITKDLLEMEMDVIMGCRKIEDGNKFVAGLLEKGLKTRKTPTVTVLELDLASLKSVKKFAEAVLQKTSKIDLLINNAGIITMDYSETIDKFESTWQVNYLSPVLLTHLLLPTLTSRSHPGTPKIVNTNSLEHEVVKKMDYDNINNQARYDGNLAYSRSKAALMMYTLYLSDQLREVEVIAAHPGIVNTEIFGNTFIGKYFPIIPRLFFKTPEQGAKTIVYAAVNGKSGEYIGNCAKETPSALTRNKKEQQELFEYTAKVLQIS